MKNQFDEGKNIANENHQLKEKIKILEEHIKKLQIENSQL